MLKKIRKTTGATLSETLVTVVLMSIVLAAVMTGIATASNSYRKIVVRADAMTLLSTISVGMEGDLSLSQSQKNITVASNLETDTDHEMNSVQFNSQNRGYSMSYANKGKEICIVAKSGTGDIYIPVATGAAHTAELRSRLSSIRWDDENGYFEYTIEILPKEGDTPILSQDYVTRP